MRITFNPAVVNTTPVKPIHRVIRRDASLSSDPIEQDVAQTTYSVQAQLSDLGLQKSKEDIDPDKPYKKNPIWNAMLNI